LYNPTISSELDAQQWLTSRTNWFNLWKEPWWLFTEGWLGSRDGLVNLERRKIFYLTKIGTRLVGLLIGWSVRWMGQLVVWLIGGLLGDVGW
jgi:hypothetical protein